MRGVSPRKGQKTTSAKYEDLAKLGRYLGAKDVKRGTDKNRKAESAKREADLIDAYRMERGGGQGKAAPKPKPKKSIAGKFVEAKASKKMTPTQRANSFAKNADKGTWNVSARKGKK